MFENVLPTSQFQDSKLVVTRVHSKYWKKEIHSNDKMIFEFVETRRK